MFGAHNGLCAIADYRSIGDPDMYRGRFRGRSDELARGSCCHWAKALGAAYKKKCRDDAGHAARSRRSSGRRRGAEPWQRSCHVAAESLRAARTDAGRRGGGYGCRGWVDLTQNRAIGRAYLVRLYGHYKNWPDAVAAYNWGVSNLDTWIKAGRPLQKLLAGVAAYTTRVLHDSGLCSAGQTTQLGESAIFYDDLGSRRAGDNPLTHSILAYFDANAVNGNQQYLCGSALSSFSKAGRLRAKELATRPKSRFEQMTVSARRAWRIAVRGSQI